MKCIPFLVGVGAILVLAQALDYDHGATAARMTQAGTFAKYFAV